MVSVVSALSSKGIAPRRRATSRRKTSSPGQGPTPGATRHTSRARENRWVLCASTADESSPTVTAAMTLEGRTPRWYHRAPRTVYVTPAEPPSPRGSVVMHSTVDPTNLLLVLAVIAAFGVAAALVIRALERRERRAVDGYVLALWEALALARQDLRLEVNERGERFLHGTVRAQRYTLSTAAPGRVESGAVGISARIQRDPAPRVVVWATSDLPAWAPRLPRKVTTGHDEFDQIFTVHTDDEALCLATLDVGVREALLGIPGAGLVCDDAKLTLVTSLEERQVDAEFVDQVRAVVSGVCAPGEVSMMGN
jgi:hypothetical protein